MIDIAAVRADTPGCAGRSFLDSAGSSLPPAVVVDTMIAHLRREAEVGGYRAALERLDDLNDVRAAVAELIGAQPRDIALSDSATRSWSDFFFAAPLGPGDRILISRVEYASNAIEALQRAEATGATVELVPSDELGRIDLGRLDAMLDDRVKLVSVVHAPTNGGLLNPVREVSALAHRHGALVLLDACQSIGQVPIDVTDLGVDGLSATGRKWLRGPRGTGFLYVAPTALDRLVPRVQDLRSAEWTGASTYRSATDATRFELWEHGVAARLGLGAAVRYLLDLGIEDVHSAVSERAEYLRDGLGEIAGVTVRDLGDRRSGIVTFTVDGRESTEVRDALAGDEITVTVSFAGSTRLDMEARGLDAVVRASPHYFVSFDDLDRAIGAVRRLLP
jgi:cysteine desulfurase